MIHSALSTALIISAMADLIFAVKSYIQIPALQKIIAAAYAEFMVLHFKAFCKVLGRVTGKLSQKQSQRSLFLKCRVCVVSQLNVSSFEFILCSLLRPDPPPKWGFLDGRYRIETEM